MAEYDLSSELFAENSVDIRKLGRAGDILLAYAMDCRHPFREIDFRIDIEIEIYVVLWFVLAIDKTGDSKLTNACCGFVGSLKVQGIRNSKVILQK
jgi:hypothetical protein